MSLGQDQSINHVDVENYFGSLQNTIKETERFDKPGSIYNVDGTGVQLNTQLGHVFAEKGAKDFVTVTSGEKGDINSCIGCGNAEGVFLPPVCVFKGKNLKSKSFNAVWYKYCDGSEISLCNRVNLFKLVYKAFSSK